MTKTQDTEVRLTSLRLGATDTDAVKLLISNEN